MRDMYHVSCDKCGHDWWDPTGFPTECPRCHNYPYIDLQKALECADQLVQGNNDATYEQRQYTEDYGSYQTLEDEIIDRIVDYLCTDHTESELMELVKKAIALSNGE